MPKRAPLGGQPVTVLGVMKTYKVVGNLVVHEKQKGDLVDLWDTGATRALVQAGHLVEVVVEKDQEADSADSEEGGR
jgi:hypothetical protein